MLDDQLPWDHRGGTGVCLSGGGIRAAAFALGTLQSLQEERGLLFGERSAHYLSAVSGGSYTAAAFALNAKALEGQTALAGESLLLEPPLAVGSPETEWIMTNGDYLKRWGRSSPGSKAWWWVTVIVMAVFGAVNLLGFVSLFALVGGLLAGFGEWLRGPLPVYSSAVGLALGILAVGGIWLLVRLLYELPRPWLWIGVMFAFALAGAGGLIDASQEAVGWLSNQLNAITAVPILIAVVVVVVYLALSLVTLHSEPVAEAAAALSTLLPRIVGLVALAVCIDRAAGIEVPSPVLIPGSLILGFLLSIGLSRVSLHRLNRDRIAYCFARVRSGPGEPDQVPHETALSSIGPTEWPDKHPWSFPRLMICATANVRRRSGQWAGTFEPFAFSHDFCWLPRDRKARYATEKLEQGRRPAGRHSEPVMTLMTAVATAGAAVSPSMGSKTRPGLRSVIALLNLRLGTWFPNPVSSDIRDEVASADSGWWLPHRWWQVPKHVSLGGGYDEFVPELFGLDNDTAPRVYASDGGHYDNLGLLMLLRAHCEQIWCVDSQADPNGEAGQLRHVVSLAEEAGLVEDITLDCDVFAREGDWQKETHAIGDIHYSDGTVGKLIVIKLGLTEMSDPVLKAYHKRDARWPWPLRCVMRYPHDSTFLHVSFGEQRMRNYRHVGYENAQRASRALST